MADLKLTVDQEILDGLTRLAKAAKMTRAKLIRSVLTEAVNADAYPRMTTTPTQQPRTATQPRHGTTATGRIGNRPIVGYSKETQSAGKR